MPALVPGFEYDIFISYRQNDNRSGWVREFVSHLNEELSATQKEPVAVYFDENPHDGLNAHHDVDDSLREKLKCLIFIPIVSRTYCDPNSFAWKNEFLIFVEQAREDSLGMKLKLQNGNVATRVLTVQIHEIDKTDAALFESVTGSVMRPIDFVYKSSGVNRPLMESDKKEENANRTLYRDQINKVANAIDEMIKAIKGGQTKSVEKSSVDHTQNAVAISNSKRKWLALTASLVLVASILFYLFYLKSPSLRDPGTSGLAVLPFRNNTGLTELDYYGVGMASEISKKLSMSKQFNFLSALQATLPYNNSTKSPKEIGSELGVDYLLSGIYQKEGQKIKVDIELLDAKTGKVVWTLPVEGVEADFFQVQADIAQKVLKKFTSIQSTDKDVLPTSSLKAYEAYVRGMEMFYHAEENVLINDPGKIREPVIKQFEKAIQLDSNFQEAWLMLVDLNSYVYLNSSRDSLLNKKIEQYVAYVDGHFPDSWQRNLIHGSYEYRVTHDYTKALSYITKVIEVDPDNQLAIGLMSYLYKRKLEYGKALEYKRKFFEINPNISGEWKDMADILSLMGDYPNARRFRLKSWEMGNRNQMEVLLREFVTTGLSPDSVPADYKTYYGDEYEMWKLMYNGEWQKAIPIARKLRKYESICLLFQLLNQNDSVRYYAELGLKSKEEFRGNYFAFLGDGQKAMAFSNAHWRSLITTEDDKMYNSYKLMLESMLLGLAGDYLEATRKVEEVINKYPDFNEFAFLTKSPFTEKIRREYPPFLQAINNRKQKPILDVKQFIKF